MKVLVTGGAGFIGYHLARRLADQENTVVVSDNLSRGAEDSAFAELLRRDNVSFIRGDLTDAEEMRDLGERYDLVYHLAAVNGTRNFYEVPHLVLRNNLLSLVNVLEWLRNGGGARLIWTSSSEVCAGTVSLGQAPIPTPEDVALTIQDISNPRFSYAASKIAGESLCLHYAKAYGLSVTVVRPHNIYGPRMGHDHVIPQFISRVLRREDPFRVFGGEQSRAFCFVDDMVRGLELAAGSEAAAGEIVNIGNDREEVRIIDLAERMFDLFDFHPQVDEVPAPAGSVHRRCPDITKARRLFDYSPEVSLEVGLPRTCDSYRAQAIDSRVETHG
jgi:nucleoside-diphosphate-sugar epimerase